MNLIPASSISSSGLQAERTRMEVAAHNLANAHASPGPDGKPFQRSLVLLQEARGGTHEPGGVKVAGVTNDNRPPKEIYAPGHPDANEAGMIQMPNITPMEELLDMITASRSYEANLSVMKQGRQMAERTIELLRRS